MYAIFKYLLSAFRKGHSCQSLLLKFVEDMMSTLDKKCWWITYGSAQGVRLLATRLAGGKTCMHMGWHSPPSTYLVIIWVGTSSGSRDARTLQWRHNGRDSVSNPHDCWLNDLFSLRSKKTWKLRVTGLCAGNSPGTGEFPAQMASNAENVSIWWRHHENLGNSSQICPPWDACFFQHFHLRHVWFYGKCSLCIYTDDNSLSNSAPSVDEVLSNLKHDHVIFLRWVKQNGRKSINFSSSCLHHVLKILNSRSMITSPLRNR